jgi:Ni/Fe-hydrogenase subunit HybB-like protein
MMSEREGLITLGILGVIAGLVIAIMGYLGREVHAITWGLFVPSYVYFALISIGSSIISGFCVVFKYREAKEKLLKYARLSSWFSLVTIIPAWLLIILDLTRPTKFYLIYLSFNPESRIAWMAAFYSGFALFLLIELLFFIRAEASEKIAKMKTLELIIASLVLILELGLAGNLAQVFGSLVSVPFWYGVHMVPLFISFAILLGASGASLMLTPFMDERETRKFVAKYYGKIVLLSSLIITYFLIWIFLTSWYNKASFDVAREFLAGRFSKIFWLGTVAIGIVTPIITSTIAIKKESLVALRLGAIFALIGGLVTIVSMIILPQTMLPEVLGGYRIKEYHITGSELAGLIGAFVLWPSLYLLGTQLLAVLPKDKPKILWIFK